MDYWGLKKLRERTNELIDKQNANSRNKNVLKVSEAQLINVVEVARGLGYELSKIE